VAADGVMMIAPVNWFQVSSPLKLMMDRLVCAEGGNPDPTATQGKDAAAPKTIELEGWTYPRHLEGRAGRSPSSIATLAITSPMRRAIRAWIGTKLFKKKRETPRERSSRPLQRSGKGFRACRRLTHASRGRNEHKNTLAPELIPSGEKRALREVMSASARQQLGAPKGSRARLDQEAFL
jgi:NADPH-dependent FMN reductase